MQRLTPLLLLPLLTACATGSGADNPDEVPFLENVLTLDLVVGEETPADDVLLVRPDGIAVDDAGNIYTADEYCVKVFDPDGRLISRIGREGQGPGEFEAPMRPTIGPTGYLTVQNILWECNIYSPDHEFIRKTRYQFEDVTRDYINRNGFTFTMLNSVISLDPEWRIIDLFGLDNTLEERQIGSEQLIMAGPDTVMELVQYPSVRTVKISPNSNNSVEFQGELIWALMDAGTVAYTHTALDYTIDREKSEYHFCLLDLSDLSVDTLTVPFVPLHIPDGNKKLEPVIVESIGLYIEIDPFVQGILDQTENYPPLMTLLSDGHTLFGFHYSTTDSAGRDDEEWRRRPHSADIVDPSRGGLIARARFPFIPDIIRDGYAYQLYAPDDDYPLIRRYRIDERISGNQR